MAGNESVGALGMKQSEASPDSLDSSTVITYRITSFLGIPSTKASPAASIMPRAELPINALPIWCRVNDVCLHDVEVGQVEGSRMGLLATRDIADVPVLMKVPRSLVLSAETL